LSVAVRQSVGIAALVVLALYESYFLAFVPAEQWSRIKYGDTFIDAHRMATYISETLKPGESFYEWGNDTGLYYYSNHRPVTGLFIVNPLLYPPITARLSRKVLSDLKSQNPEIFVRRTSYKFDGPVPEWIKMHYVEYPEAPALPGIQVSVRCGGRLWNALAGKSPEYALQTASRCRAAY
jgi:hypothetical protein